ncbi:hypothetical protein ACHAC9_23875, partial [Massilia sp. CMS3.1]|uniref:hypothetical protein n=1 Tax=Massilia sp. CMS3.1 TaxID=3373083 RepID=UPI003EE5FB1A
MNQFATIELTGTDVDNQHHIDGENSNVLDEAIQAMTGVNGNSIAANPAQVSTVQAPLMQEVAAAASKKSQRRELFSLLATAFSDIEAKASAVINAKHQDKYEGSFEVHFDMPS